MTFLEIVQKVVRYSGLADSGPATVSGQVGDYRKAIAYVQDAHAEIQSLFFDWFFLWSTSSFVTASGIDLYPPPQGLGIWDTQRIYINGAKIPIIDYADYVPEAWDNNKPRAGVIRPDNQLIIIPPPDGPYTISYDYYRSPAVLSDNTDTPLIPAAYRNVIVGRALMLYGNFESAEEVKIQGAEMYQVSLEALMKHQLSRRQQTHGRQEAASIQVTAQ